MEVELMVTKRDDDRRQGEYRAICLWKMDWQSFAISPFSRREREILNAVPQS